MLRRLLGLPKPVLAVSPDDKAWLEESFLWLMQDLRKDILRDPVILPTAEFFPDEYAGRQQDVMPLLRRVCEYMNVDPAILKLEFYSESNADGLSNILPYYESQGNLTAGHYRKRKDKHIIAIETSQLNDTMSLVGTIAHELGHVILLGGNRIPPDYEYHEPLTDLLTVNYGLGLFTANSAFTFSQWEAGGKYGWQSRRLGYLSEEMFGYALALFAWVRAEQKPVWRTHLKGNVRPYLEDSLAYLAKTNDCLLPPGCALALTGTEDQM